ncbi:MAG: flap structure-specific endonuclease [Crenarchaeota archaeon]|nr:flap structure-specific endonuclease [Thermoproteota archaeon]
MGVRLGALAKRFNLGQLISPEKLVGKVVAVDALVTIYQMLATIRGPDGYFLVDSQGRITSHLVGIFNRECHLMSMGIRSIYVFDGPPLGIKAKVLQERKDEKMRFHDQFLEAVRKGDVDRAIKLGKRAMFVNDEVINQTKTLLKLLGIPIIQAPHDAEAQAAYIVKEGDAYAISTRDWDALVYGSPRIIMHWRVTDDPYLPTKLYTMDEFLDKLKLSREQLVDLAILLGTDFNPGGFKGIGPLAAYKLIRTYKSLDNLIKLGKIRWRWDADPNEIREVFLNPPITENYKIEFKVPDEDGLMEFLVEEHDFSVHRVRERLREALRGLLRAGSQTDLTQFFGF